VCFRLKKLFSYYRISNNGIRAEALIKGGKGIILHDKNGLLRKGLMLLIFFCSMTSLICVMGSSLAGVVLVKDYQQV